MKVVLESANVKLRALELTDTESLAQLANDKTIYDHVRDYFPYPYTTKDARSFILATSKEAPVVTFAITYKGSLAGVIGIKKQTDIYRKSGEVGYWMGAPFRGKGITPSALALITEYAIKQLKLNRLYAGTFASNQASIRVLEKCGYLFEGVSKKAIYKNGQFLDEHRYAFVHDI